MKKIILMICTVFLLSGCTVNYNIAIKNNGETIEKTTISGQKINSSKEFNEIKKSILSQYSHTFEKYGYKYNIENKDNVVTFSLKRNSNINTLFNRSIYNELFEDHEMFDSSNTKIFKTIGSNYLGELFVVKNYEEGLKFNKKIDTLRINITFENKVLEHNADEVNNKTNTYTWIFTKKKLNKNINFKYDTSKKVVTIEKDSQRNHEKRSYELNTDVLYIFATAAVIAVIILIGVLIMFRKSSRVNKL